MKKIVFTFILIFTSIITFAQIWQSSEVFRNPVTNEVFKEYCFDYQSDKVVATVKISPMFKDMILIETNVPIGQFKISPFRHTITSKSTIKLYNQYDKKLSRSRESLGLGFINTNKNRTFATLKNKDVYNHLMNKEGYIVLTYSALFTNEDIDIVINCIND